MIPGSSLYILQGYSNQNSMVLVPKQRYRTMEQNIGCTSNATHLQQSDFDKPNKNKQWGKHSCLINGVGKTG